MTRLRRIATNIALAVIFWLVVAPAIAPRLPSWWWFEPSGVRVDSDTLIVTVDRTIRQTFNGRVEVTVRQIGALEGSTISTCRPAIAKEHRYIRGTPYTAIIQEGPRKGQLKDIDWFMDSPPNAGCELGAGTYRAHFTWYRDVLFGLVTLRADADSNIFYIGPPPEQLAPLAPAGRDRSH